MPSIEPLDPASLNARLSSDQPPLLLDVREYPDFATGHIREAQLWPLGEIEKRAGELPGDRAIITVCRSGRRSEEAGLKLLRLGFKGVAHLEGGMKGWTSARLPVDREARASWALERQVRLAAGLLALLGLTLAHVWAPAILLAWLVLLGVVFAAVTNSCAMGMFLAKMPWNKRAPLAGGIPNDANA